MIPGYMEKIYIAALRFGFSFTTTRRMAGVVELRGEDYMSGAGFMLCLYPEDHVYGYGTPMFSEGHIKRALNEANTARRTAWGPKWIKNKSTSY